jgi:UDP-N-acetylmuramyl tripeptide synthase
VLRDERVQAAVLETARGGLLRRGLAVDRADVAVVTNVAADHLGDYGIFDVPSLAQVKTSVAQVIPAGGWIVLNAEDTNLRALAPTVCAGRRVAWFSPQPQVASMARRPGDAAVVVRDGWVAWVADDRDVRVVPIAEVPVTYGATARFNVENVLAATAAALALDLPPEAVARGLRSLRPDAGDSPGRQNAWLVDGVHVLLDFGHNPHGVNALMDWVARFYPAGERTVLVGQAGDRDDGALRDLVRATLNGGVTRAVTRPMPGYARGRDLAEVPRLLARFYEEEGLSPDRIVQATSEADALERALAVSRPGDLVIMLVHVEREPVAAVLAAKGATPA